jgi:hypothetical protein
MTVKRMTGVGCARLTQVGDWAFAFALGLAKRYGVRLNIFFFPGVPCQTKSGGERPRMTEAEKTELERSVRLHYERRLGDFMNVGFRGCEGEEEPELLRCLLVRKDYDVLVLPYEDPAGHFRTRPIEDFAARMPCPTVLVGPNRSDQLHLNTPAMLWMRTMGLSEEELFAVG